MVVEVGVEEVGVGDWLRKFNVVGLNNSPLFLTLILILTISKIQENSSELN